MASGNEKNLIRQRTVLYYNSGKNSLKLLNDSPLYKESWLRKYISTNELFQEIKDEFNAMLGMRGPNRKYFMILIISLI